VKNLHRVVKIWVENQPYAHRQLPASVMAMTSFHTPPVAVGGKVTSAVGCRSR
jgi:hypothetical protein